jgi:menaquinone-dependent protoporphyrinogen oxidase
MNDLYLVTYASRMDSTAGVAEAIGRTMAECGLRVDVLPVNSVKDLAAYHAVVAGSAIQGGAWLPEAMQFLRENQTLLRGRPFAAFQVCMTLAMPSAEKYRDHVAAWMQPVRALVPPLSEGLFAGALDLKKIPGFGDRLKFRISVLLGVWKEGDHRDWPAIEAWARSLPGVLKS